jgi:small-conductance mechanosensitive channel
LNPLIVSWMKAALAWLIGGLLLLGLHRLRQRWHARLKASMRGPGLTLRGRELLPRRPLVELMGLVSEAAFALLALAAAYLTLYSSLLRFEATTPLAQRLLHYALDPLEFAFQSLLDYVPKAFFILAAALIAAVVLRILRLAFGRVESGFIRFDSFPADWALPTYKIVRFLVLAFAAVVIWPYLPGSQSEAFKGISLFVGVLISLSSSSALANLIAGVILTYTRAFKNGDRIIVAASEGTVLERTLLVTRLRNVRNVVITVPNAKLLSEPIQNLGGSSEQAPLMLSARVGIGYDAPWAKVHALLLEALQGQAGVLADPPPKVWQRSLDDFSVLYELCWHSDRPRELESVQSAVHASIQDRFAAAGIEIMTPHYRAERDGSAPALPPPA